MDKTKRKLLVVEDDLDLHRQLSWAFADYDISFADNREAALSLVASMKPPVVTVDLGLPPDPDGSSEGLATLGAIISAAPTTKVIVVTGNEDRANALKAVQLGAYDFYQKPIDADVLSLIVSRAYNLYELESENRRLAQSSQNWPLRGIVTSSLPMLNVCRAIEKVAPTNASVFLLGESGTGKELCARALHEMGPRVGKRFVAINCAAIPENLLESELFGHEKGSFTGAIKQVIGKIQLADKGTLFLDEIGDMSIALQAKLLRFLQERKFERIGGREEISVDVRVVCATHHKPDELITAGRFREDLYYRLSEIVLQIPPLRQRSGDAVLLAHHFLNVMGKQNANAPRGFTSEALGAVASYQWPGNVRELENRMKRAVIMSPGPLITPVDLDLPTSTANPTPLSLREIREQAEREAIQRALAQSDGNISQAAKLLGISRPTLYGLMNEFGMRT
jgi:two-component system, NtrC family, response regulator